MNFPFDKIHSVDWSYGWLVFPWFGGWVAKTKDYGIRFVRSDSFHNCRKFSVGSFEKFGWMLEFTSTHLAAHRQKAGNVASHRCNVLWYRDMRNLSTWKYFLRWCFGPEANI